MADLSAAIFIFLSIDNERPLFIMKLANKEC